MTFQGNIMNINPSINKQNFCSARNPQHVVGVSVRISPHIRKLTEIANLRIEENKAIAYTSSGNILSMDYNHIINSLRNAVTELSATHKYNSARGTWCHK